MSNFTIEERIANLESQIAAFKKISELPIRVNTDGSEYMPVSVPEAGGVFSEQQLLATTFFGDLLGNTPAKIRNVIIDYDAAGTTAEKIRVAVNADVNYPIEQGTLYLFKTNRIVLTNGSGDGIPFTDTDVEYAIISEYHVLGQGIAMLNGSASIGQNGTVILEGNILYLTTSDFRSFESTEFDLGDIGASTIEAAVNVGVARSTPQEATIYFKAVQNAENKLWLYQGAGIEVGTGKPPTVAGDYRLFPDSDSTDPNPPYQESRPGSTKTLGNLFGNINLSNFEEFEDKLGWSIVPAYGTRYEVLRGQYRKKINAPTQPTVRTSYEKTAGAFVIGLEYTIKTVSSTDFTLIGASANTVGIIFTATGVGTGTGVAYKQALQYGGDIFAADTNMFMYFVGRYGDNVEYRFENVTPLEITGSSFPNPDLEDFIPDTYLPSTVGNFILKGSYFTETMTIVIQSHTYNYIEFVNSGEIKINMQTSATDGFYDITLNNGGGDVVFPNILQIVNGTVYTPSSINWIEIVQPVNTSITSQLLTTIYATKGKARWNQVIDNTHDWKLPWKFKKSPLGLQTSAFGYRTNVFNIRKVSDKSIWFSASMWCNWGGSGAHLSTYSITQGWNNSTDYKNGATDLGDLEFMLNKTFEFKLTAGVMQIYSGGVLKKTYSDVVNEDVYLQMEPQHLDIIDIKAIDLTDGSGDLDLREKTSSLKNDGENGTGVFIEKIETDTAPKLGGELDLNGHSVGGAPQTAVGDGSTTIDWKLGNFFHLQFGAFSEVFTFTAPTKAGTFILKLTQDSVGSRTGTFPAAVKWIEGAAPTLTTTATTGTDIITFYFDGTNYYAVQTLNFS